MYLKTRNHDYMDRKSLFDVELFAEIDKLSFRDGLLHYNRSKLVIPTKLRTFIRYHIIGIQEF